MAWQTLVWEQLGPVLRITANRPHVLNAQSRVLIEELDAAFTQAVDSPDVRVIVVAGAGKHFSAGHDLGSDEERKDQEARPRGDRFAEEYAHLSRLYLETTLRWRDVPKPTIAQVQGYCIMGGLMLASACDLIVASEDAMFADRSVGWGGSHVQYFSLPWDVGARKAKELLFTGEFLSARQAEQLGLVNRVVPRESLEEETLALARKIAEQEPFGLALAKRSVNDTLDIQGQRQALEVSFKNYMLTIPNRKERGTFGAASRDKSTRERFAPPAAKRE